VLAAPRRRDHLWTTIRREEIASLAELAARVDPRRVKTVRFVPPDYPEQLSSADVKAIRRTVRRVFEGTWSGSSGAGSVSVGKACP
jgi:hypothetical protein